MKRLLFVLAACAPASMSERASEIANGTPASPQARPWAAFLEITPQNGDLPSVCSGALVAPNKVLTAAHCVVCASAVSVRMLGSSTFHTVSSWTIHPEAFPDQPVNCDLQTAGDDAEAKINIGADLAVVTLGTPSQVTPISVLTTPPYGWNPVSEVAGVTILGRGPSSLNDAGLSTMREGAASLDALSATPEPSCDDVLPATSTLPFLQLWNSGSEAAMLGGDSGGPMVATFWGTPKVIGVASWYCADEVSYYPPTFAAETGPFLAGAIGVFPPGGDGDEDHVVDSADNCAGEPNTTQDDTDEDGVGDACDACDEVDDPEQENCNAEAEKALGVAALGDACDPTKCATVEMEFGTVPQNLVPQPLQPCAVNGYAIATCHWEMPVGFAVRPVGPVGSAPTSGSIGLRHCRCDAAHDSPEEREAACRSPSAWTCDVDAGLYASGAAPWRAMATASSTPVTFNSSSLVKIPWDSVFDLEALGTGSLPAPPWSPSNGFVGTAKLDGIVWAHAIGGGDLASSYAPADHRFRYVYHWKKIPRYAPAWPWEYCAACQLELPWVSVLDPVRRVVLGIGPDGARAVSLANDVIDLIARGRVITAAESAGMLDRAGVARRAIVVDTAGAALGALTGARGASVEAFSRPALGGTDSARVYAYSALRGELYAVRLLSGASTSRIERLGARWQTVPIAGATLGVPLAATIDARNNALYIVDRAGDAVRLVRVDLVADRATVIAPRLLSTTPSAVSLSLTPAGELLLVAGSELAWIANGRLVGRAGALDVLAGDARELALGVHFAGERGAGFVPAADRRGPTGEGISPVF
ncbi:MAG: trypsin-like serine protease [Myxococcota bacterium]|nr:trypsin-like serine protease [Myxococcota bacterium]